jgi:RNA polymerase sigma-70 factor (ECF subfamily)
MHQPTKDILDRCKSRERASLEWLYDQVMPMWLSMSGRYFINKEDRHHVANTAFMKLVESLKKYEGNGSFEAWCRRIMSNTIIDEYRKQKNWRTGVQLKEGYQDADIRDQVYSDAEQNLSNEDLEQMILNLPVATRGVFNLFAIEGYSHDEISAMTGISAGTSKWHVSEARRILKQLIEDKLGYKPN